MQLQQYCKWIRLDIVRRSRDLLVALDILGFFCRLLAFLVEVSQMQREEGYVYLVHGEAVYHTGCEALVCTLHKVVPYTSDDVAAIVDAASCTDVTLFAVGSSPFTFCLFAVG
jgi:hypothetical protein